MSFRADQLKVAIAVLSEYIETQEKQQVKALRSSNTNADKAYETALHLRHLDQLQTKLKADLKAVTRKTNQPK